MASNYKIIGIHGLRNKPPEPNLSELWERALEDGLKYNERLDVRDRLDFELVYWADFMYPQGSSPQREYPVLEGPYPSYEDGLLDALRGNAQDILDQPLDWAKRFFGIQNTADTFLKHRFDDLARYYAEPAVRKELRGRLRKAIDRAGRKRVMVIAHSMGSIVAYDALRELGKEQPNAVIDHFVTIGSPLGLPHCKLKILVESGSHTLRTPSVVRRWSNLAERRDPVSFDNHLAGDYRNNFLGVQVLDDLVCNDLVPDDDGQPDFHSSIGYLRCPEMSHRVREFL